MACAACARASGGACRPQYTWSWTGDPAENDRGTFYPGLQAVRGLDVLLSPGVTTVARWGQSNWPALLVRSRSGGVRATTRARRNRMCHLWQNASVHHSWPILLGCPGWDRKAHGAEAKCATQTAVFRSECSFVDFAAPPHGWHVKGTIYNARQWFRLDQSKTPPAACHSKRTLRLSAFGTSVGVFAHQTGHFVAEQLAHLLLLHDTIPAGVPILAINSPVTRRYLQPLFDSAVVPRDRVWLEWPLALTSTTIHAASVYAVGSSYFGYVTAGERTIRRARAAYTAAFSAGVSPGFRSAADLTGLEAGAAAASNAPGKAPGKTPGRASPGGRRAGQPAGAVPRHVLLIHRGKGADRSLLNSSAVEATIRSAIRRSEFRHLPLRRWSPSQLGLWHDMDAFRSAALIIAPHGAGLANLIFAAPRTPVIEVCFDNTKLPLFPNAPLGMDCPDMYALQGVHLGLPYWVVTAAGVHASPMAADLPQLSEAVTQALGTTRAGQQQRSEGERTEVDRVLDRAGHHRASSASRRQLRWHANGSSSLRRVGRHGVNDSIGMPTVPAVAEAQVERCGAPGCSDCCEGTIYPPTLASPCA